PTNVDDSSHLVDVIASWNPSDNLGVYVNFDYVKTDQPGAGEISTKALAAASRLAISDTTGIAARFEYLSTDLAGTETTAYTVTGTVDHALTDNLTARAEIRWDMGGDDALLFQNGSAVANQEDSQVVGVAQLVYSF
ncbi:porin, partial [Myxococcota bacterium]|nr:porin [Myxococcota bacterium]